MDEFFAEGESEAVEQDGQHFEVVLLFVTHHVDHLINRIILKTQFGRSDILRHIDRSTIGAKEELLIQSVFGKISPNRPIFATIERTTYQPLFYFGFALEIGVRFVIYLIKRNAHALIGLIKTGVYPAIHLRPKSAHFGIVRFPFTKHFLRFEHERRFAFRGLLIFACGHEFGYLRFVFFIETNVVIADEVIAFLTGRFGRLAIPIFEPCEHGFADMNASIVDDIGLHNLPSIRLLDTRDGIAEEVITYVTKVQRLIRIRRTIFDHHELMTIRLLPVVGIRIDGPELTNPERIGDHEV